MISVAVKVETACGACRMPMPVNTLAREARCPSCGRSTGLGDDLWKALLRDPLYNGPRLLANEVRRSSAGKLSAAYTRRGPRCQGCDKEIPVERIQEVREQAMLRCERCAVQTWVRAVPAELAGALPNVTHLVGEEPDRLAGAAPPPAEAATFPCPQCGSPIAFDGVSRACTCRFCNASVHVPDEFVYRGQRRVVAHWYLCFHPSVTASAPAAQAVSAGLFDWDGMPVAVVDAEGNLYCAATQSRWYHDEHGRLQEKIDHVLWSMDPSLNIRWLQRDRAEPARLLCCLKDRLLVIGAAAGSPPLWLSSGTGTPVENAGAVMPSIEIARLEPGHLTCDRDGSLLLEKDGKLRRIAPDGTERPVWAHRDPRGDAGDGYAWGLSSLADCPVNVPSMLTGIYCGPDGSLYLLDSDKLARFDASGRKVYCEDLDARSADRGEGLIGADLQGNALVLRRDRLVRVSAAGGQGAILVAERDALPHEKMRVAVCPDGSFWLFGEKGLAWKLGHGGRLVFASEKEPRPKKPTVDEVVQQRVEIGMEMVKVRAQAELENLQRICGEMERQEKARERRANLIAWIFGIVFFVVLSLQGTCY
ncbi:hypothetical protein WMF31_24925 [Sorangium sp. So ce1036]|uniref:hypothetical protein n=1 Tax=Sorangium sp. So ce1036 TaxID=3133328 RepID=UPI003F0C5200